jgi:hypothetical protein
MTYVVDVPSTSTVNSIGLLECLQMQYDAQTYLPVLYPYIATTIHAIDRTSTVKKHAHERREVHHRVKVRKEVAHVVCDVADMRVQLTELPLVQLAQLYTELDCKFVTGSHHIYES